MIAYLYLTKSSLFDRKTINATKSPLKIRYQLGASVFNLSNFPEPTIKLISVLPNGNRSITVLRASIRQVFFVASNDKGETWLAEASQWMPGVNQQIVTAKDGQGTVKLYIGSNLKQGNRDLNIKEPLMSRIDSRILYDCPYNKCKKEFQISSNAGMSWTQINPLLSDGGDIDEINLLTTGMHSANRIYAVINTHNEQGVLEKRIAVSNDNGRYFDLLPWEIINVAESWADPLVLYGEIYIPYYRISADLLGHTLLKSVKPTQYEQLCDKPWLAVSRDAGKTWEVMVGSREIYQELYEKMPTSKNDKPEIRSWKEHPNDREFFYTGPKVMQIESDLKHPEWIYVLTYTGLYISQNMGNTFKLANLMQGWIRSIDQIAVDPIDGRYLYATVDLGKIYRSSDYGNTWELIRLPLISQQLVHVNSP